MKKVFNLSVILAVLMAAFSFTSCSDDDDDSSVSIDNVAALNNAIIATITSDADLETIEITNADGSTFKNITKFDGTQGVNTTSEGVYTLNLTVSNGTYYIQAIDVDGTKSSKEEVVVGNAADTKTFTLNIGGGSSSAGSYISIVNEKVYTSSEANANAAAIEIVFDGTAFKSAKASTNSAFTAVAYATVTMSGNGCTFETSTGYTGKIEASETLGDAAKTYTVTVSKIAK